ncbi:MAG: AbrB/MazE/SpoVT family DNA-binding domain-containing protein [Vicinamibacterales bacterium]
MATRARIVRIGNSQGIRVPRSLLEQAHLREEVELYATPGKLIVRPVRDVRAGWAEAAKAAAEGEDVGLLDPATPTRFDEEEWEW